MDSIRRHELPNVHIRQGTVAEAKCIGKYPPSLTLGDLSNASVLVLKTGMGQLLQGNAERLQVLMNAIECGHLKFSSEDLSSNILQYELSRNDEVIKLHVKLENYKFDILHVNFMPVTGGGINLDFPKPRGGESGASSQNSAVISFALESGSKFLSPKLQQSTRPSLTKRTDLGNHAKFTLNAARNCTQHDADYDVQLGEMMDMPKALGHLAGHELKYILTSLAKPTSLALQRSSGSKGKLVFQNFLSEDILLCEHNFRDARMADFHMDDVVQLQIKCAHVSGNFKYIIRKHISSPVTIAFLRNCAVNEEKELSSSELAGFLSETPNGKSSARIANRSNLLVSRGIVVKEECEDEAELYSVFLETRPKSRAKA